MKENKHFESSGKILCMFSKTDQVVDIKLKAYQCSILNVKLWDCSFVFLAGLFLLGSSSSLSSAVSPPPDLELSSCFRLRPRGIFSVF